MDIPKHQSTVLTVGEARANFTDLSNRVSYGGERVIVKRYKKPVMAMVPMEDLAMLEALENDQDLKDAKKRLRTLAKEGTLTLETLKKELED